MLVGDYCPRALDPIFDFIQAEKQLAEKQQAEKQQKQDTQKALPSPSVPVAPQPTTELPCNVFGTVDRCDGMVCEHDGNCFSGCCSMFVSSEQKRCMPLVSGDMCPIAVDVVQQVSLPKDTPAPAPKVDQGASVAVPEEEIEDHPIVEKSEHHELMEDEEFYSDEDEHGHFEVEEPLDFHFDRVDYHDDDFYDDPDRIIPMKHEHHEHHGDEDAEVFWDLEEQDEDDDRIVPTKSEHKIDRQVWHPELHQREESTRMQDREDGINEKWLTDEETHSKLKPVTPKADDPRLQFGKGKGKAEEKVPQKEPAPTAEHKTQYGKAYEQEKKAALKGER